MIKINISVRFLSLQYLMIQASLSKKIQGFRNSIRREEIEAFKKNRRKELIQFEHSNTNTSHNHTQLQQIYWGVLRQHELANLQQMSFETIRSHIQMLKEVIMSQESHKFIDAFQRIIIVLIDFYQSGMNNLRDQAYSALVNRGIGQQEIKDSMDAYSLTKLFSFIPVNGFLVIIGAIYHDIIASSNMLYLQKVIFIFKQILHFSFLDSQTVKRSLEMLDCNLDYQLNKTINKNHILTTFLNISYSQEDDVLQLLKKQNVFGRIQECVELYGISQQQYETLCGMYCNTIEYLCRTIGKSPVEHEQDVDAELQQASSNNLYLFLFEQLLSIQSEAILENMVHVSACILRTISEHNLPCKSYIMELLQGFIRKIIQINQYLPQLQRLFIVYTNLFDFRSSPCPSWLIDFLQLILKSHLTVYFDQKQRIGQKIKERYKNKKKGTIARDINQLMKGCQQLLARCDEHFIQFQECLVNSFFDFWCKEDPIMGYVQLIGFLQVAIDKSSQLAHWIIFECKKQEYVHFLDYDYENSNETRAVLQLIYSTCNRIEDLKQQEAAAYLRKFSFEWGNILTRIDGQCHMNSISTTDDVQFAMNLYERVERMLISTFHQ